jgi:lipoate-protein ligase B
VGGWTVEDLGRRSYAEVLALQHARVAARQLGEIGDTLILVEHDDVVTLGRRRDAQRNLLPGNTLPVVEIERGGDATYHGPGQLVVYPILLLEGEERDLHAYLRNLEEAMIRVCADHGLPGGRNPGWTGTWIGPHRDLLPAHRKIGSIGIAVRRWVTFHGLAFNVSTDLSKFALMNPCGLEAQVMTSLSREVDRVVSLDEVKPSMIDHLATTLRRA